MSGVLVLALRLFMTAVLYVFLGGVLWLIWKDLRREAQNAVAHPLPPIRLEVRARSRILETRTFSKPEIILGRNPECDILIDDATASARHARVSFHHNQWWIEDLNSTNGTKLNHTTITLPTVLTAEDEIQCGKTKVIVTMSDKEINPATQRL